MPIRDLRRKASRILELLDKEEDAVYITHYGRPVAVMVDYEHYEHLLARLRALTQQLDRITATAEPAGDYTAHLAGLHQEVWEGVDTDAYLQQERDAWEDCRSTQRSRAYRPGRLDPDLSPGTASSLPRSDPRGARRR